MRLHLTAAVLAASRRRGGRSVGPTGFSIHGLRPSAPSVSECCIRHGARGALQALAGSDDRPENGRACSLVVRRPPFPQKELSAQLSQPGMKLGAKLTESTMLRTFEKGFKPLYAGEPYRASLAVQASLSTRRLPTPASLTRTDFSGQDLERPFAVQSKKPRLPHRPHPRPPRSSQRQPVD